MPDAEIVKAVAWVWTLCWSLLQGLPDFRGFCEYFLHLWPLPLSRGH